MRNERKPTRGYDERWEDISNWSCLLEFVALGLISLGLAIRGRAGLWLGLIGCGLGIIFAAIRFFAQMRS